MNKLVHILQGILVSRITDLSLEADEHRLNGEDDEYYYTLGRCEEAKYILDLIEAQYNE